MGLLQVSLILLLSSSLGVLGQDRPDASVSLSEVERSIDLTSQLVKATHKLTFTSSSSEVKFVHFAVEEAFAENVAYVGASTGTSDKTYLRMTEIKLEKSGKAWKIELKKPLAAGGSQSIQVDLILGKAVEMFPKEITQREKQLALFEGNHYFYTPYVVKSQTTKFTLPSSTIESYSKSLKPVSQSDATITYGPYANAEAFKEEPLTLHYENNNPFLVITRLERIIELSMWGNIAIEETVDIKHNGAKLLGSFSRYEFQRENSGVNSVKNFKTVLPAAASDVYYRDDIGNISTSALRVLDDAVELDLRPRFPLFGGWKTHYFIGYNVPSYEYLFIKGGDNFVLNMRLLDHVYDDMLVEDFKLKIILPEGCQVGKFHSPYPTTRKGDALHFTYLDVKGRPVVNIENVGVLTEKHIQDFQLEFVFPKSSMVQEPLLLVVAFFLFFVLTIIYVRLDFAITKDEGTEAKMKVAGVCEKVLALQEKRNNNYTQFDDALSKLKSSKDNNAFLANIKKVNSDHKNMTQDIADLVPALKTISADTAEKVLEVQKLDRAYRESQQQQYGLVEKLVGGKLPKPQFIEQETALNKKKSDVLEKMQSICSVMRSI